MNNKMHLWIEDPVQIGPSVTLGATLESGDGSRKRIWFRVPEEFSSVSNYSHDSFVLASLFHAMRCASDLIVHGSVSPSLLRNLEEFHTIWNCWLPEVYARIDICADDEKEYEHINRPAAAIAAFSGGADSCFTIWHHKKGLIGRRRRDLKSGLMIHGLDIPLPKPREFELAVHRSQTILESVGVALIPMATNFRELDDEWVHAHGAAIASCLTLFKVFYSEGLIASSPPYNKLHLMMGWGSNPLTDGLFSSDGFRIIHDGANYGRHEKIHHIADWPEAMDNIRVCWEGERKDRNCGCCEKCIRTILSFRAAGIKLPASFEKDITDQHILELKNLNKAKIFDYQQILSYAKKNGCQDAWMTALEKRLKKNSRNKSLNLKTIIKRVFELVK